MQRIGLSIFSRCRRALFRLDSWMVLGSSSTNALYTPRRFRSSIPYKYSNKSRRGPIAPQDETPRTHPRDIPSFFRANVAKWAKRPQVRQRLVGFGVTPSDVPVLLNIFVKEVEGGMLSKDEGDFKQYRLARFAEPSGNNSSNFATRLDQIYTNIFYTWASSPPVQSSLSSRIGPSSLSSIHLLSISSDLSYPADAYPMARSIHRKIIMHVGPTNSGKTHNALRALAGAKLGVYAGPLRLLAHEIWERLNRGAILPLGVEPEPQLEAKETEGGVDVTDGAKGGAVRKTGDAKYARECNLLTGEEQKIVSDSAGLLSCTVEMINPQRTYDVAVVDEVQLLADPERGGAWTSAILGLCAHEVHLCGEEAAVPLVEALVKDTGDTLIVHRYSRLTPLLVQRDSLDGDLGKVRKGDCVVTFSRSNIFKLKKRVEELTGLRCAVAYGRLPPETRSEQAALFNDPGSGYDVMIGSDAIGMGLNLKIKRVVFETVKKFDGSKEKFLSVSQMKQIAGRAGRYGLHEDDSHGGYVTTLHAEDLPVLRDALSAPPQPLTAAYLPITPDVFSTVARALPPGTRMQTVYDAHTYVSNTRSVYRVVELKRLPDMTDFVDRLGGEALRTADRVQIMSAPIPWQDAGNLDVVAAFLRMYSNDMRVDLYKGLHETEMLAQLEAVEDMMRASHEPVSSPKTLGILEGLHKLLVLYMWMSFRSPVAFADHEGVYELKVRTEKALDWCLQGIAWGKGASDDLAARRGMRRGQGIKWKAARRTWNQESKAEAEAFCDDFAARRRSDTQLQANGG